MSKISNKAPKVTIDELLGLFNSYPERAFSKFISSGIYFNNISSTSFWTLYTLLDFDKLHNLFPWSTKTFNKMVWLKTFHDLNEFYKTEKANCIRQIIALNPSQYAVIKSFFLSLELGEADKGKSVFPSYTKESLGAIKYSLREIFPKLKTKDNTDYSASLNALTSNLIKIQADIALNADFLDAFLWSGFEMSKKENGKGFRLGISAKTSKANNLFILNRIKNDFKRNFKRKESHPKISDENHFKTNDPKWKTGEGLATIIHGSGITVTDQPEGTTSLKIEDSVLLDMASEDKEKKQEGTLKMMSLQQEQNFHYMFRNALSEIYQPNDEIEIHDLHLQLEPDIYVTLYEIISAMSCLIAKGDTFRYISEYPTGSIRSYKNIAIFNFHQQELGVNSDELRSSIDSYFIHSLSEVEKQLEIKPFIFIEQSDIISLFRKVEELKNKTTIELESILKVLSGLDSPLPFNPLYKVGEQYYFSYWTCHKFNLNRILYDNYISDKLFNPNNKQQKDKIIIGKTQNNREVYFTNSLKNLFKVVTPFVDSGLEFGDPKSNYDFGELKGEFDVIAYFEKENILFPIQVKLSNVSPRSEKRKEEWIDKQIREKAISQVIKDVKLLKTKSGLRFVADKLNFAGGLIIEPKIYPIILTDNFLADHLCFSFNETKDQVRCISYFELKHLILGEKIHEKQQNFPPLSKGNAGQQLIESIENNIFWNFLDEFSEEFRFSKKLSAINEANAIEMIID